MLGSWTARTTQIGAEAYVAFFERTLAAQLRCIDGHRGAVVLTRATNASSGDIEITELTSWRSLDAVAAFAGESLERAIVEPEARAVLTPLRPRAAKAALGGAAARRPKAEHGGRTWR